MPKSLIGFVSLFIILSNINLNAQTDSNDIDKAWENFEQEINGRWESWNSELKVEWTRMEEEVEKKWDTWVYSTNKDWVEYNNEWNARSHVDFETGNILLEIVIPSDTVDPEKEVKKQIRALAEKIFKEKGVEGKEILNDLIRNKSGVPVNQEILEKYINDELLPELMPEAEIYKAQDGIIRRRYSASVDMVPDHIQIRAGRYLTMVENNARRFKLNPQLIMAIIHTESFFNPKAISGCNAIGLMQIVPSAAGRDAYMHIYGEDKVLDPEYLFDPVKNIELGCAYLYILKYKHFKYINGEIKNRYISICGYNWGPTKMRQNILNLYNLNGMSDEEVYNLLRSKTPSETREYIRKVVERMPIYNAFFN